MRTGRRLRASVARSESTGIELPAERASDIEQRVADIWRSVLGADVLEKGRTE